MKAISLTYIPMPPQIYICSTGVFRPPFKLAPRHFHLFTSHLAQCLGHGECLINALCDDKHVFSDTTHSVSTSLPGTKVRHTYLYFSAFRVAVAICQVWSTVPICNKLHFGQQFHNFTLEFLQNSWVEAISSSDLFTSRVSFQDILSIHHNLF